MDTQTQNADPSEKTDKGDSVPLLLGGTSYQPHEIKGTLHLLQLDLL